MRPLSYAQALSSLQRGRLLVLSYTRSAPMYSIDGAPISDATAERLKQLPNIHANGDCLFGESQTWGWRNS
jgi:hypothetical protein